MAGFLAPLGRGTTALLAPVWQWWIGELSAARAAAVRRFVPPATQLVLAVAPGGYRVYEETGDRRRSLGGDEVWPDASSALAAAGADARNGVVLRLRTADCFQRTIELPRRALADADRILALDLERTTPFRRADVMTAVAVSADARGERVPVRQLVAKAANVRPHLEAIARSGRTLARIDVADDPGGAPLDVDFLGATAQRMSGLAPRRIAAAAVILVALMGATAYGDMLRHTEALDALRATTAAARTEAEAARKKIDRFEAAATENSALVRLRTAVVPRTLLVEELTRLLPDTVWLSELRIDGDTVELSGFAPAAALLVRALERSAMFGDPALAGPVTFDPRENKERFTIRAKIVQASAAAVTGGG
jgi:general secretion pathway protein L